MRLLRIGLLAALPTLGGCMSGLLYTHTWEPLSTNFDKTPVCKACPGGESDVRHVSIPFFYHSLDFMWHSNAIGDIAARDGINDICYADLETFSIIFGIWNQYTVHVYGKSSPPTSPKAAPTKG